MSTPETAEMVAQVTKLIADQTSTVAEVKRFSATQELMTADATPWASWVTERLPTQQSEILKVVAGATNALDELRGRLTEAEKVKSAAPKTKREMSRPKDIEPVTFRR